MRNAIQLYNDVGDSIGVLEYIQHMGSDQMIIDAARVSFAKDVTGGADHWRAIEDPKLLRYLIKNQHWSPLEHCAITWHVVVPLFTRGQWHRHRTWSYNEVSRRYTEENLQFYLPEWFRPQADKNKQASLWGVETNPAIEDWNGYERVVASEAVRIHTANAMELYEKMLNAGICREQARMVLPQNMYVRYYGTVNLRNALAFIKLRDDNHAQWEIFQPAQAMKEQLRELFPEALAAYYDVIPPLVNADLIAKVMGEVNAFDGWCDEDGAKELIELIRGP
jgi:thymidylate synthase (FAD)